MSNWPIVDMTDNRIIYGYVNIDEWYANPDELSCIPLPCGDKWLEITPDMTSGVYLAEMQDCLAEERDYPRVCVECGTLISECSVHTTQECPSCRQEPEQVFPLHELLSTPRGP
jgi:hypothetical protein